MSLICSALDTGLAEQAVRGPRLLSDDVELGRSNTVAGTVTKSDVSVQSSSQKNARQGSSFLLALPTIGIRTFGACTRELEDGKNRSAERQLPIAPQLAETRAGETRQAGRARR